MIRHSLFSCLIIIIMIDHVVGQWRRDRVSDTLIVIIYMLLEGVEICC